MSVRLLAACTLAVLVVTPAAEAQNRRQPVYNAQATPQQQQYRLPPRTAVPQQQMQQQVQPRQAQQQQQVARPRADMAARPNAAVNNPGGDQAVREQQLTTIFSQIVLGGLNNPTDVAIQPTSGDIFVADSGAARVVRVHDVPGEYRVEPIITGFQQEDFSTRPAYKVGPLGIKFLNKYTMAVSGGGQPFGEELIGVYRVPHAGAIDAGEAEYLLGPVAEAGNFFGLEQDGQHIYIAANTPDQLGAILRSAINGGQPSELETFVAASNSPRLENPTSLVMGRRGEIIVASMGAENVPNDSRLTFFDPRTGKAFFDAATKLHDIMAIAISPQTGRIYAVDFARMAPQEGGLYRLDIKKDADEWICEPVLLMPLDRPAGMAFRPDGELLITTFGSHKSGHEGGLLVRVYNDSKL